MASFLAKLNPIQLQVVRSRIGGEANSILDMRRQSRRNVSLRKIWLRARLEIGRQLLFVLGGPRMRASFDAGWFRQSGEVHRVMYDQVSLGRFLLDSGFVGTRSTSATDSMIPNFEAYGLDAKAGVARKPDSIYMEVVRSGAR